MKKTILMILLLFILYSCKNISYSDKEFPIIDIEANINNLKPIYLSQFTDEIKYVPLEYVQDKPVTRILYTSQDHILTVGGRVCQLYNSNGNFVAQIGKRGQGPGEYSLIVDARLYFNNDLKIFLSSGFDLLEYKMDGSFFNSYNNILRINDIYNLRAWRVISDSLVFGYINNGTGRVPIKAVITDKSGRIKHAYKNYVFFDNEKGGTFGGEPVIFYFNGTLFSKEQFNDTIFSINERFELVPSYKINLGKYELPLEIRMRNPMGEEFMNYIFVSHILPIENYLLIVCNFGKLIPAKRITPKNPVSGPFDMWRDVYSMIALYDIRTRELVFSKPTDSDNPLFTSGIYNDIDCGPRFLPRFMVNDSTMMMSISANQLKNHVASNDFKNGVPKNSTKKKELEELANNLSMFDNPVMMLVTYNH